MPSHERWRSRTKKWYMWLSPTKKRRDTIIFFVKSSLLSYHQFYRKSCFFYLSLVFTGEEMKHDHIIFWRACMPKPDVHGARMFFRKNEGLFIFFFVWGRCSRDRKKITQFTKSNFLLFIVLWCVVLEKYFRYAIHPPLEKKIFISINLLNSCLACR